MVDQPTPGANGHASDNDVDLSDPDTEHSGNSTDPVVQAELQTLETILRQPRPEEPFADESGCRRVVELVAAIGRDPSFDATATGPFVHSSGAAEPPRKTIGQYQLLATLGQGGMGTVYKALHTRLQKVVALKLLPRERLRDEDSVSRFNREMEIVGQLDHPNIVAAHDAGDIDGDHYLVMELIDGVDLSVLVSRLGPLPIREACELIRQTAKGLQHAHGRGCVHREIKPSNLMLATASSFLPSQREEQGSGVKILDLGLAILDPKHEERVRELTSDGQMMGTLDYMAPEQCDDSHGVDIRADIYSLGATLYKLLCGHAPFADDKHRKPMSRLKAMASEDPPPLDSLRPDVPSDLAALVQRVLSKSPAERPATPAEIAEALAPWCEGCDLTQLLAEAKRRAVPVAPDVRSHSTTPHLSSHATDTTSNGTIELGGSAVASASEAGIGHEAATVEAAGFRTGWKVPAIAAGLVAVAVLAVTLIILTPYGKVIIESEDENVQVAVMQGGKDVQVIGADSNWSVRVKEGEYEVELRGGDDRLQVDKDTVEVTRRGKVVVKVEIRRPGTTGGAGGEMVTPAAPLDYAPGTPLSKMALVTDPAPIERVRSWTVETVGHRAAVRSIDYSPDGRLVATGGLDGTIRIWDAATKKLIRCLVGYDHVLNDLAWSPSGSILAASAADWNQSGILSLWDAESGRLLRGINGCFGFCWSPDDRKLAVRSYGGKVVIWSLSPFESQVLADAPEAEKLAWSPDGKTLAGSTGNSLWLWDVESASLRHRFDDLAGKVISIAWSPDGKLVAISQARGKAVAIFDSQTGTVVQSLERSQCKAVTWSHDGKHLALNSLNQGIRVWKTNTWELEWDLDSHPDLADDGISYQNCRLDFSPDDETLAAATIDGTVVMFDCQTKLRSHLLLGHGLGVVDAAFYGDGTKLASVSGQGFAVRLWDASDGHSLEHLDVGPSLPWRLQWSGKSDYLAVQCVDKTVLWNMKAQERIRDMAAVGEWATLSADGRFLAVTDDHASSLEVWDIATREVKCQLPTSRGIAFSPNGEFLAVRTSEAVRVYESETGRLARTLTHPAANLTQALAWSPDGKRIAAGNLRKVYVWDTESDKPTHFATLPLSDYMWWLGWLDNGRTLAAGTNEQICVWDLDTKRPVTMISGHPCGWAGRPFAFSPERRLAGFTGQCLMRIRSLDDGRHLHTILSLRDEQWAVVSPDGHFRGSPGVEKEFRYVVQRDDGRQVTLTPKQFRDEYGWNNDLSKVRPVPDEQKNNKGN